MQENTPGGTPHSDQPDHGTFGSDQNPASPPPPPPPPPPADSGVAGNVGDGPPKPPSDFLGNNAEPPIPPPSGGRKINPKLLMALAVAVVLGLAAATAIYFLGQSSPTPTPVATPVRRTPSPSPSGLKPGQQVAVLKAASGYQGSGEAARSAAPGRFVLTVTAQLPDTAGGGFYQVWLVRPSPFAQFPVGKLTKQGNRWVFTLDQTRDASDYRDVMVTLERTDDKTPETRVLTGSF